MKSLTKQTLKIFWQHSKKYPWQLAILAGGIVIVTAMQTYMPLLYRDIINIITSGKSPAVLEQALSLVVLIFIINLVRIGLWRLVNFVNNYFQPKVMGELLNTCYEHLQKHSYSFFSSNFVGSLVTKVKRYERSFEQISDQIIYDLGRSLLDTAMVLAVTLWQYPMFGLIMFGWCILFFVFSYVYAIYKLPYDIKRAAADTKTTAQLADSITNNINIKLFTNYQKENRKFFDTTLEQFKIRKKSWDLGTVGDLIQSTFMIFLEFAVIYLAVKYWQAGTLQVGDVALLQAYIFRISDKLWNTGKNVRTIYEALADANEMTEMLITPHQVKDAPSAKTLVVKRGEIEFKNVDFGYYGDLKVLESFNLKIPKNQKVAIIGPSGGGKSTIIKLLFRFLDITNGKILIDGQDISAFTQDSLRTNLALVPQDPILFHRTLLENISYAKPKSSKDDIIKAARAAHCHEFISSFPDGYETLVGERGIKLSGGERQRVAIARAILKDAPILVLDEATSSLDSESEMYIQDALKSLMKNKTTIVIAHRLSTIMQMDRIIVLEKGKITEEGKHAELLKAKQGTYQKLWEIQAGSFSA
jgi:ATP-binding cassette, subfamily B, bacterial